MQKVQSYLYPNRIILLADLAGFTVENKVVYARTIKIYQGVDNVIEFDIQNADQKRIDLATLRTLEVNVMDASGKELNNSPYSLTLLASATATGATVITPFPVTKTTSTTITIPTANITGNFLISNVLTGTNIVGPVIVVGLSADIDSAITTITITFPSQTITGQTGVTVTSAIKGLATITIPQEDISEISSQTLTYSVTALDSLGNNIVLYTDSAFNAAGTIQVIGNAMPIFRNEIIYDKFAGEINYMGNVINHTSAIPCKFYEAETTQYMDFEIDMTAFIGTIYVEATEDMTISVESFRNATQLQSITYAVQTTTTISFNNVPVINPVTGNSYNYMRVSWLYPSVSPYGPLSSVNLYGMVNTVTVSS